MANYNSVNNDDSTSPNLIFEAFVHLKESVAIVMKVIINGNVHPKINVFLKH